MLEFSEVFEINVEELREHPANSDFFNQPTKDEVDKMRKSLEKFGQMEPIIVNSRNMIVSGHLRFKILRDFLGAKKVQVRKIVNKINDEEELEAVVDANLARRKLNADTLLKIKKNRFKYLKKETILKYLAPQVRNFLIPYLGQIKKDFLAKIAGMDFEDQIIILKELKTLFESELEVENISYADFQKFKTEIAKKDNEIEMLEKKIKQKEDELERLLKKEQSKDKENEYDEYVKQLEQEKEELKEKLKEIEEKYREKIQEKAAEIKENKEKNKKDKAINKEIEKEVAELDFSERLKIEKINKIETFISIFNEEVSTLQSLFLNETNSVLLEKISNILEKELQTICKILSGFVTMFENSEPSQKTFLKKNLQYILQIQKILKNFEKK